MLGLVIMWPACHVPACQESLNLPCSLQVEGKTAVIVGDSNIVGMPLAMLLRDRGAAAVTVCHRLSYQVGALVLPQAQPRAVRSHLLVHRGACAVVLLMRAAPMLVQLLAVQHAR